MPNASLIHPAVSAEVYSDALYLSYSSRDPKKELFHWLLARADSQDLEEVRKSKWFSRSRPSFKTS